MLRRLFCAAVAALLMPVLGLADRAFAGPLAAGGQEAPSSFAVPIAEPLVSVSPDPAGIPPSTIASGFTVAYPGGQESVSIELDAPVYHSVLHVTGARYESSRYRPRRSSSRRGGWRARGVSQVHAGFLDPDGPPDAGFLAGFRGGQRLDDVVEIGLGIDWRTKSGRATEVVQESIGPGGETIVVRRDVSSYSSNLFPLMAYLQISGPSHLTLVPYAGVAASWQVLFLDAHEYSTGQKFDATFDGFGWQLWGGVALPLTGRSRLVGEVFMNQADLHRDLYDPFLGEDIRETVSVDGVGARFGMNWGF